MKFLFLFLLPLAGAFSLLFNIGRPREVDTGDMIMKATGLMTRVKGMKNFGEIMNLMSRLNKINTAQFSFLGNGQQNMDDSGTFLVDISNKINNILTQMTNMSDDDLARGKGFGALVLASNQLNSYLKQNQPAWMNFVPDLDFTDPAKALDNFGFGQGSSLPDFGSSSGSSFFPGGFNVPFFG